MPHEPMNIFHGMQRGIPLGSSGGLIPDLPMAALKPFNVPLDPATLLTTFRHGFYEQALQSKRARKGLWHRSHEGRRPWGR